MTLPTSHCEVKTITCTTGSECPASWTCMGMGMGMAYATAPATVEACATTPDGGIVPDSCFDATPAPALDAGSADAGPIELGHCYPPDYAPSGSGAGGTLNGSFGSTTSGSGMPPTQGGATGGGSSAGQGAGGDAAVPSTPSPSAAGAGNGAADNAGSGAHNRVGGGGCQAGAGPASAADGALFGLLAFVGFVLRRRDAKRASAR